MERIPAHGDPGAQRAGPGVGVAAVLRLLQLRHQPARAADAAPRTRRRPGVVPRHPRPRAVVHGGADRVALRGFLHAAPAGRAAVDLGRRLRGRRDRRRRSAAAVHPHHPAADPAHPRAVHDPVRHRFPARVRPVLHPHQGRPGQQHPDDRAADLQRGLPGTQRPRSRRSPVPPRCTAGGWATTTPSCTTSPASGSSS